MGGLRRFFEVCVSVTFFEARGSEEAAEGTTSNCVLQNCLDLEAVPSVTIFVVSFGRCPVFEGCRDERPLPGFPDADLTPDEPVERKDVDVENQSRTREGYACDWTRCRLGAYGELA